MPLDSAIIAIFFPFWELTHSDIAWLFIPFLLFIAWGFFLVWALPVTMFMLDHEGNIWLVSVLSSSSWEHQELETSKELTVAFCPAFSKSRHSPLQSTAHPEGSTEHLLRSGWKNFFDHLGKKIIDTYNLADYSYNIRNPTTITWRGVRNSTRDYGCHKGLCNIRGSFF